jgi:hypothetical protein
MPKTPTIVGFWASIVLPTPTSSAMSRRGRSARRKRSSGLYWNAWAIIYLTQDVCS